VQSIHQNEITSDLSSVVPAIAGCGDNLGGRCYVKNNTEEVRLLTKRRVAA
jgi:hypothetical protein